MDGASESPRTVPGKDPVVRMESIVKDFTSTRALDHVSLTVRKGEVHGLIGENGAGKSTLMNILGGALKPSAGNLYVDAQPVAFRTPAQAKKHGIAMIHQELNVVDELTVAENIFLGHETTRWRLLDRKTMARKARNVLQSIGCAIDPNRRIKRLSIAEQQMVEIAKALSHEADVLIMDEPTAVLTPREVALLMELIRDLRRKGVALVYISHILPEVLEICDRVTVLRDGQVASRFDQLEAVSERDLANCMVGRDMSEQFPERIPSTEDVVLAVDAISVENRVDEVSFTVKRGEILGFAGLIGAGRTDVGEALAGLRDSQMERLSLDGQGVAIRSPADAVRQGIAYVSEDRRATGLVMGMSVTQNITLVSLRRYGTFFVDNEAETAAAQRHVAHLAIKVGDVRQPVETLSGGNQQKVALAKWLEVGPTVLILDEPTRGIDVGAKAEIYRLIHDLAARGKACIVISSEMNELLGLCHRIAVMRNGRLCDILDASEASERAIMQLAAGVENHDNGAP